MADGIPNIDFVVTAHDTVTVPIDATLSIAGQAADAKAVGDALALKADKSELARSIHVNGQGADLQGEIIVTAEHVPMDDNEETTVADEVDALKARTGADIPINGTTGAPTIAQALELATEGAVVENGVVRLPGVVADSSASAHTLRVDGNELPLRDSGAVRSVNGVSGDASGDVHITHVEMANNLVTDDTQSSLAAYVLRTSGGSASVATGDAWLAQIRGAMAHTGEVREVLNLSVLPASRESGEEPITATLDADEFRTAVSESTTLSLTYDGEDWSQDPSGYGITVTGTPVDGDALQVVYVKADRGLITPATPTSFRATGWNLYQHSAGYARVVRYSDSYGFRVEGAYSGLSWSETESGARTPITPTNGAFTVPGDGYVWVTGGNASTTAIYMTWSDWTGGYDGTFAVYTESVISIATIMAEHFPYGLLAVGGVADVIDLDLQTATSTIERLEYTPENLALVEQSGRAYVADTDYIYAVRAEPVVVSNIGIGDHFIVDDHGLEYVTGTTVAPELLTMYGLNLRDKLRSDVVTISQQTLSESQKTQVRSNIGAVAKTGDTMTGPLHIDDATSSTSASTGALVVSGGAGIGGALSVGDAAGTRANLGITPANIGAAYCFHIPKELTNAPQIFAVLDTLPRGFVGTIVTRTDASNAMCGVGRDMYGTIWRNASSSSNNFYLSMTTTTGDVQYCYSLTLTDSSMSHGTVNVYNPST